MTTAVQIGETARDRADFCRCFKAGAAVLLHDDGMAAHCTYRNTLSAACPLARMDQQAGGWPARCAVANGPGGSFQNSLQADVRFGHLGVMSALPRATDII